MRTSGSTFSLTPAGTSQTFWTPLRTPPIRLQTLTLPLALSSRLRSPGGTPDEELTEGTTITVTASATNIAGTSGPVANTLQPAGTPLPNLSGLTSLYTGNNNTNRITNGIDLVNDGGMVWLKSRSTGYDNYVYDTERGTNASLKTNEAQTSDYGAVAGTDLVSFNEDGFTLGPINTETSTTLAPQLT